MLKVNCFCSQLKSLASFFSCRVPTSSPIQQPYYSMLLTLFCWHRRQANSVIASQRASLPIILLTRTRKRLISARVSHHRQFYTGKQRRQRVAATLLCIIWDARLHKNALFSVLWDLKCQAKKKGENFSLDVVNKLNFHYCIQPTNELRAKRRHEPQQQQQQWRKHGAHESRRRCAAQSDGGREQKCADRRFQRQRPICSDSR